MPLTFTEACPAYRYSIFTHKSPFFGAIGCAASIIFSCFGAAYGTAKSGVGIAAMGVMRPELIMKNVIPVVMVTWCTHHRRVLLQFTVWLCLS
jgi:V-type H+-transporting ATPase proteolipid subunit